MNTFIKYTIAFSFIGLVHGCKKTTESKVESVTTEKITFTKESELTIKRKDSVLQTLDIEIADDDYQIQTGLMYREHLESNQGMLFIFNDSAMRYFYMKNTFIALDIIYVDASKKIVSIQKNAKPLDETTLPSEAPAQYVLEINGGLSDQWNLQKGDLLEFNL